MVPVRIRVGSLACVIMAVAVGACASDDSEIVGQPSAGSSGAAGAGGSQGGASQGGASQGGSSQAGAAGASSACEPSADHSGEATFYAATGGGNCSFDPTPQDLMVGAMNHADYAASAVCGACVSLHGPDGDITIRVVDQCPECQPGDIDLSESAFAKIADPAQGRVPITWSYTSCPVQGPIVYHFKDGSNPWWTAVQLRNHRYRIQTFEYLNADGVFEAVPRVDYNYFVKQGGMGEGPYTFRVTDVHGHVLQDSGIPGKNNADVAGASQFPACP